MNMKKLYILLFLLLSISSPISLKAQGIYYVSISKGSDENNGLDTLHALKTIHYAQELATAGDTIALRAGDTWSFDYVFTISRGGDTLAPIVWDGTIWGAENDTAVIKSTHDGGNAPFYYSTIQIAACGYVVFENIIVDVNYKKRYGIAIAGDPNKEGPIQPWNTHDITIQNCTVKNVGNGTSYEIAIVSRPWKDDVIRTKIIGNKIYHVDAHGIAFYPVWPEYLDGARSAGNVDGYIGYNHITDIRRYTGGPGDCIDLTRESHNCIIEHNYVSNSNGTGFPIAITGHNEEGNGLMDIYPHNAIVRYNHIDLIAGDGIIVKGNGPITASIYGNIIVNKSNQAHRGINIANGYDYSGGHVNVYFNTIYVQEEAKGFVDASHIANFSNFKNNIIVGNTVNYLFYMSNGSCNHSNNLFFNFKPGNIAYIKDGGKNIYKDEVLSWETSSVVEDPLFEDLTGFNLHLHDSTSPAWHAGIPIPDITEDMEGIPMGEHPSIGCYQKIALATKPAFMSAVIEDENPTILQMNYDQYLNTDSVPSASAFKVLVNGINRNISHVKIINREVQLTLADSVKYGDVVTISYTQPGINALCSVSGLKASSISNQPVRNNILDHSLPPPPPAAPVAIVNYDSVIYSGFVGEIDASASYDKNNETLTFHWTVPDTISVSSNNKAILRFLAPMVSSPNEFEFFLQVSNEDSIIKKNISVQVLPYYPQLDTAKLTILEASDYAPPHVPAHILDHDPNTWWAANGIDHYITFSLDKLFSIKYLEISFQPGQKRESYFDIEVSADSFSWQTALNNASSCDFSGKTQIFPFPENTAFSEYKYLKLIGKSNSHDTWNTFSEIRIRGTPHVDSITMTIYPNPASDHIHIVIKKPLDIIENSVITLWTLSIFSISESLVYQDIISPSAEDIEIPLHLGNGVYVVQLITGPASMLAKKLVIIK